MAAEKLGIVEIKSTGMTWRECLWFHPSFFLRAPYQQEDLHKKPSKEAMTECLPPKDWHIYVSQNLFWIDLIQNYKKCLQ